MKRLIILLAMAMLFSSTLLYAQNQTATITGTIYDTQTKETIPNANIIIKNTQRGTTSDINGNYALSIPTEQVIVIEYRFTGMETQTKKVGPLKAGATQEQQIYLQEGSIMLDAPVITAGKYEEPLKKQTTSIEIIKPDLVENGNSTRIDQALEKVPSVNIIDGQANIRGGSGYSYGSGSRVLLLTDGIPALLTDAAFPQWDFIPIENLSQVEVLKGASSALYGSSALNGIIHFRTAYPTEEPYTQISLFGGIYGKPKDNQIIRTDLIGNIQDTTYKAWWGNKPPHEEGLSIAHRQRFGALDVVAGGYFYNQKSWIQDIYNRRGRMNVNLRYRFPKFPNWNTGVGINGQLIENASFFIWDGAEEGAYRSWEMIEITENKGHRLTVDPFLEYVNADRGVRHKFLGRWYSNRTDNQTNQSNQSNTFYGEYQLQKRFASVGLKTSFGLVGSYAKINAELYGNTSHNTSNGAIYAQLDKEFGKLNLSVGGRYELNNTLGVEQLLDEENQLLGYDTLYNTESRPVFRFGLNYELSPATFLRASYGQGYRYPTIAEKFIRTNLGAIGILPNPSLKSEIGQSAEIGLKQGFQIDNWQGFVDVTGFWNAYSNMMEFNFGNFGTEGVGFKSQNVGDTQIWGGEMTIAGRGNIGPMETSVLAGYTYISPKFKEFTEAIDLSSSADYNVLKYRFRHTAKADIESKFKQFSVGGSFNYRSKMEAIDEIFNALIPGVKDFREAHNNGDWTLDARISYQLSRQAKLGFICKNVFNREYTVRPAIIEAPRNYTLKYTHEFGKR